jgi:hypothetical protein
LLSYTIADTTIFKVDKRSGVISLAKTLDYEKEVKYKVYAFVDDGTFVSIPPPP